MVACSPVEACAARTGGSTGAGGGGTARGCGSGVVGVELTGPVWLGFHIALKTCFLFCPLQGLEKFAKTRANGLVPKKIKVRSAVPCAYGESVCDREEEATSSGVRARP